MNFNNWAIDQATLLINTITKEEVNKYIKEYENSNDDISQEITKVLKIEIFYKTVEKLKEAM